MSNEQTVEVQNTEIVTQAAQEVADKVLGKPRKPRKPIVTAAVLIAAIKAANAATPKKTAQEVADELGMEKSSFDQRFNALRQEWRSYGFVVNVKLGKTAADLKMSQEDFDKKLESVKADGIFDGFTEKDVQFLEPFPFTLADGRSNRDGETKKGATVKNALLAALKGI